VTWERQEEFRIISEAHAFDQRRGRLVHQSATTVADFPGDRTWEWLGEGPDQGWIERFPEQSPGPRNGRLAFDYARGKVVVFGTRLSPLNDLWEWDGNTWTQVNWTVGSTPNPFSNICFVSDPVRKKIVLVGSVHFWETWEWDGVQWTSFGPDSPPIENAGALRRGLQPLLEPRRDHEQHPPRVGRLILGPASRGHEPPAVRTSWSFLNNAASSSRTTCTAAS
jgi:hypothetical protein